MALALTRKDGEVIFIGPDICVVVKHATDGRVRVVIEAPRDVDIKRAELVPADDPRWLNLPQTR